MEEGKIMLYKELEKLNENNFYGFYDWHCTERSLKKRSEKLKSKLKFLKKIEMVNDEDEILFYCGCAVDDGLYDRLTILDKIVLEFSKFGCALWIGKEGCEDFWETQKWSEMKLKLKELKL